MKNRPIAVLAGTPVDTQMGVEMLSSAGLAGMAFPLAKDPVEQTAFQISPPEEIRAKTLAVLREAQARGCEKTLVYCNSLSGSVDFSSLAEETGMRIVTPLEVYRAMAPRYRRLALIAANAQGLSGIEAVLYRENPQLELRSVSLLPVVLSIEAGEPPAELTERHGLAGLAEWFRRQGAEALILGCTHFPYFKAALARKTALPLLDPAEEMLRLLRE